MNHGGERFLAQYDVYKPAASAVVRVNAAVTTLQRCVWSHVNRSRCDVIHLLHNRMRKLVPATRT
jgi:hypothetical protein